MLFGVWDSNLSHASTPLIFPGLFVFAVVNQPLCTLLGASAALLLQSSNAFVSIRRQLESIWRQHKSIFRGLESIRSQLPKLYFSLSSNDCGHGGGVVYLSIYLSSDLRLL